VNLEPQTRSRGTLCDTANGATPLGNAPAPRTDEVTRPVDAPVVREHGLTGRLLMGTDLRLETRVGRGASAMVYRATRARGGAPLAVKVLHERSKDSVRQRFLREVEILRQIHSPWVVKVAGKGTLPDGRPWYAMEYVDGQSLARVLNATKGGTDPARVVGWLRGACRGLSAIHAAGWVHRDVKPANLVVVSVEGIDAVKIIDLGIAECIGAQPELLSGTPEYIAPEQAEFRPVDVRSDVYALGCCAYELLTGRRLVEGRSAIAKINVHIDGVKPQWPRGRRIPYVLRRLVERCLSRLPEERPSSMLALELELERVAAALLRMEERKTEPMRPAFRAATRLDLGDPITAANQAPRPEPDAPVWRLSRSWSTLANTLLSVLSPSKGSSHKQAVLAQAATHQEARRAR
jgi:serine/threonine protein kinase